MVIHQPWSGMSQRRDGEAGEASRLHGPFFSGRIHHGANLVEDGAGIPLLQLLAMYIYIYIYYLHMYL